MKDRGESLPEGSLSSTLIAAAHELKAPLALIRQLALSIESHGGNSSDVKRLASRITLSSERALRLTSDLTRASRLQDTLFELGPVNPVELCEDIAYELKPLFEARGATIRVKRNRRNILAVANRDLLRRIVSNFSDNALEYVGEDSVVELTASSHADAVRIGVRDYGPALPNKVFNSLKKSLGKSAHLVHARPSSSGLGLYLAAQFADYMNSEVGTIRHRDGTTFYVDLPLSKQLRLL